MIALSRRESVTWKGCCSVARFCKTLDAINSRTSRDNTAGFVCSGSLFKLGSLKICLIKRLSLSVEKLTAFKVDGAESANTVPIGHCREGMKWVRCCPASQFCKARLRILFCGRPDPRDG